MSDPWGQTRASRLRFIVPKEMDLNEMEPERRL